MQTAAPQLHGWVTQDIAKLRAIGVDPTPAEIVWLADLCRLAHTPPGRDVRLSLSAAVRCHGVSYWPLTLLANNWYCAWIDELDGYDDEQAVAFVFAASRSRPGDVSLLELSNLDDVLAALREFSARMPMTPDQVADLHSKLVQESRGCESVVPSPDKETDTTGVVQTLEEKLAILCSRFEGTTPDFWLSEVAERTALEMAAIQAAASGDSGAWSESPARTRRIANYMNAVKTISRRATGKDHA